MSKPKAKTKNLYPNLNAEPPKPDPNLNPKNRTQTSCSKLFSLCLSLHMCACVGVCVCCTRLFAASSDMKVFCHSPSFRTGHGCDYSWLWLCVVAPFSGTLKCPKSQRDVATRHRISSSVSFDSPDNAPGQVRNALTPTSHLFPSRHSPPLLATPMW